MNVCVYTVSISTCVCVHVRAKEGKEEKEGWREGETSYPTYQNFFNPLECDLDSSVLKDTSLSVNKKYTILLAMYMNRQNRSQFMHLSLSCRLGFCGLPFHSFWQHCKKFSKILQRFIL